MQDPQPSKLLRPEAFALNSKHTLKPPQVFAEFSRLPTAAAMAARSAGHSAILPRL